MAHFGEHWVDSEFPIAYLITIRTFGTWMHGDERSSVDTHGRYNVFGAVKRHSDPGLRGRMIENMKDPVFTFDKRQRLSVERSVKEVCLSRGYELFAVNARSNHVHAVVSAQSKPEPIANAFKSYATRSLRRDLLVDGNARIWSRGRSRRYLWEQKHVLAAIDYVMYCQGDDDFEGWFENWSENQE